MPEPIDFTESTKRLSLPLLFSGQAQKEFFVNEAHALIDVLLHPMVEGISAAPPASPAEAELWIAADNASGDWLGWDGHLCAFVGGAWRKIAPFNGFAAYDNSQGNWLHYDSTWKNAAAPALPSGGGTVDIEARNTLAGLIESLREIGIFPRN